MRKSPIRISNNPLPFLFLLLLLFSGFFSCKKSDSTIDPDTETNKNTNTKFFSLPANAPKALTAVAKRIQRDDNKHHFLEAFIARVGYPKWDFAQLVPANIPSTNRRLSNEKDSVLLLPFVKDSADQVNALLMVQMNSVDTSIQMVESNRYHTYGYDSTDHSKWNAWDIFHMFTKFDNIVFGHKSFIIKDPLLFNKPTNPGQTIVTLKSSANTSGRNSTNRISTYDVVAECSTYEFCYHSCNCIARLAEGWTSTCFNYEICTYYWVPSGYGSGSGGGVDVGGSGGGSGNYYYWSDPCPSGPPNPERISTNTPAAGGGGCTSTGWQPVTHGENWFNAQAPFLIDLSGLNNYPCAQALVNSVIGLNNSTIKLIKDLYGESAKFNLKFEVDPSIPGAGKTLPVPAYTLIHGQYSDLVHLNTIIKLHPDHLINATKLSIVETIIHEMIHAYFNYRMIDARGNASKEAALEQELGFLKPHDPNNPLLTATAEHEQMANNYIDKIVAALKEYRLLNESNLNAIRGIYPNITLEDYYKALAWSGLTRDPLSGNYVTMAWKAFETRDPDKAAKYRVIISAEEQATSLAASQIKCSQ